MRATSRLLMAATWLACVPALALDVQGTSTRLAWSAASGPVTGYAIEVERNGSAFREEARVSALSAPVAGQIGDTIRVRVRAFVDEPEMGLLAERQLVEITWDAQPGRVWNGKTEILPKAVVARGSRSVGEVICSVDNAKLELLPNINVNVVVRVRESELHRLDLQVQAVGGIHRQRLHVELLHDPERDQRHDAQQGLHRAGGPGGGPRQGALGSGEEERRRHGEQPR